jgi:hypothetical protein
VKSKPANAIDGANFAALNGAARSALADWRRSRVIVHPFFKILSKPVAAGVITAVRLVIARVPWSRKPAGPPVAIPPLPVGRICMRPPMCDEDASAQFLERCTPHATHTLSSAELVKALSARTLARASACGVSSSQPALRSPCEASRERLPSAARAPTQPASLLRRFAISPIMKLSSVLAAVAGVAAIAGCAAQSMPPTVRFNA